jgi:hypothetical protein
MYACKAARLTRYSRERADANEPGHCDCDTVKVIDCGQVSKFLMTPAQLNKMTKKNT